MKVDFSKQEIEKIIKILKKNNSVEEFKHNKLEASENIIEEFAHYIVTNILKEEFYKSRKNKEGDENEES